MQGIYDVIADGQLPLTFLCHNRTDGVFVSNKIEKIYLVNINYKLTHNLQHMSTIIHSKCIQII